MLSFILLRLTLKDVIADIPHDAGAVMTYAMLVLFVGFIWAGSRSKPSASSAPGAAGSLEPTSHAGVSGESDHDR